MKGSEAKLGGHLAALGHFLEPKPGGARRGLRRLQPRLRARLWADRGTVSQSSARAAFSYSPSCTYKTDLFGYNLWDWAALVVAVGSLVAAAVVVVKSGRKSCPLLTSASWLAAPRTGASLHQAAKPGLVLCSHVLA